MPCGVVSRVALKTRRGEVSCRSAVRVHHVARGAKHKERASGGSFSGGVLSAGQAWVGDQCECHGRYFGQYVDHSGGSHWLTRS